MNAHNVLEKLFEIACENWTPNVTIGVLMASTVTFTSVLTLALCSKNSPINDYRIISLENRTDAITDRIENLTEEMKTSTKQFELKLDMQTADQESLRNEIREYLESSE